MTGLSDRMGDGGWDVLAERLGRSGVYTPSGGAGVDLTVLFEEMGVEADEMRDGHHRIRHAMCTVSLGDVAKPGVGDTVTVGGEPWTVHEIGSLAGGLGELELMRPEQVVASGPGFRKES